MSLKERLKDFAGSIASATTNSPDDYSEWSSWTYETHMADIKALWTEVRPQLKRDLEQAEFINAKLAEMFEAFDSGEKDAGRKAAWAIYSLKVERLR
ncbi:hypothetical protein ACQ86G_18900 [Roseateles chitinivorans]|uniref:hypothetical protein n=1 Tax=Roseateles chitinivorans TaxID=2917965 RepID=UPI003D674F69